MSKPKSEKQQAYDERRAAEKARKAQIKSETDAVFADEDQAQVTNSKLISVTDKKAAREKKAEESAAAAMQKKAEREAAAASKKDHEAKVKAQRAQEKLQRVQDDKDRAERVKLDKEQKALAKAKAKEEKLAERAKAKAEREANKVPRRHTEASLIAKYGDRIVPGTVRFETEGVWAGKQTVEINTYAVRVGPDGTLDDPREDFDGNTRRIATSDLFQVFHTETTLAELRRSRAKESRQAKKIKSA